MGFSQEFLLGRKRHLVAKLEVTREATEREDLPLLPAAKKYKENEHIPQIIAAIKRIDAGSYGICFDCQEEIPTERLLRHPHVERCVPCQEIHDTERRKDFLRLN